MALSIKLKDIEVSVGDTVRIGQKIREGDKERIQNFEGVIIAVKGNFGERTVTVRRIAAGAIGVEKIFPIDMPSLVSVKIVKQAAVRRSKLYFLRERTGKAALQLPEKKIKQKPVIKTEPAEKKKKISETDENKQKPVKNLRKPRGRGRPKLSSKK